MNDKKAKHIKEIKGKFKKEIDEKTKELEFLWFGDWYPLPGSYGGVLFPPVLEFFKEAMEEAASLAVEKEHACLLETIKTDFPTAWKICKATNQDGHHEECSWRVANLLCDCAAEQSFITTVELIKEIINDR